MRDQVPMEAIIIPTITAQKLFQIKGGPDALLLYTFYYYTAKWQKTNQPFATNSYCMKGLVWGKERFRRSKRILELMGLIQGVRRRDSKGLITGCYVRLSFKFTAVKEKVLIDKSIGTVSRPMDSDTTNAYSKDNINAYSNNNGLETSSPTQPSSHACSDISFRSADHHREQEEGINSDLEDLEIFKHYRGFYETYLMKSHPCLKKNQIKSCSEKVKTFMKNLSISLEDLDFYIKEHFEDIQRGSFNSDGNFNHFAMTGRLSILSHRS